jgi:hypothetical protein
MRARARTLALQTERAWGCITRAHACRAQKPCATWLESALRFFWSLSVSVATPLSNSTCMSPPSAAPAAPLRQRQCQRRPVRVAVGGRGARTGVDVVGTGVPTTVRP